MWLFLNDAFLSIVADREEPKNLLVRSRIKGDIERVFPKRKVAHTPTRDYAFRASIPRAAVGKKLALAAERINYANFKDSVRDDRRHDAYLGVWTKMLVAYGHGTAQRGLLGRIADGRL